MIVDVWDISTFDRELIRKLNSGIGVIRSYHTTDHEMLLSYDLATGLDRPPIRLENPHASAFQALLGEIGELMNSRTIRAWH